MDILPTHENVRVKCNIQKMLACVEVDLLQIGNRRGLDHGRELCEAGGIGAANLAVRCANDSGKLSPIGVPQLE